jgi:hypothetical protein
MLRWRNKAREQMSAQSSTPASRLRNADPVTSVLLATAAAPTENGGGSNDAADDALSRGWSWCANARRTNVQPRCGRRFGWRRRRRRRGCRGAVACAGYRGREGAWRDRGCSRARSGVRRWMGGRAASGGGVETGAAVVNFLSRFPSCQPSSL